MPPALALAVRLEPVSLTFSCRERKVHFHSRKKMLGGTAVRKFGDFSYILYSLHTYVLLRLINQFIFVILGTGYRTFGPCVVFLNISLHWPCGPRLRISESWNPLMGFWLHLHGLGALTVAKPMKVQSETHKGVPGLRNVQPNLYKSKLICVCGALWQKLRYHSL